MPGQDATAFEHGKPGLSLSGAGTFNPIEHGKPRASTIERVPVPKSGLSAPRNAANGHAIHALGPIEQGDQGGRRAGAIASSGRRYYAPKAGVVRISSSLGEVKLNVHKVTHGLAHDAVATGHVRNANASTGTETVWSDTKASTTTTAANSSNVTAVTVSSSGTRGQCHVDVVKHDDDCCDHRWFDQRCVRRKLRQRKQRDWTNQQRKRWQRQ